VFFNAYDTHRVLHSFPTRRSSDLYDRQYRWLSVYTSTFTTGTYQFLYQYQTLGLVETGTEYGKKSKPIVPAQPAVQMGYVQCMRSEEHTSELQSRENLVCRLLLEK